MMDPQVEDFDAAQTLLVETEMLVPDNSQLMSTEGQDLNPAEDQYTDPIMTVSEVDRKSPLGESNHNGISTELPKQIGCVLDKPTNDGAVVITGSSQEDTSASVLVNSYPVSMIQWNPVQCGGTVYLIGNTQVQPNFFSTGYVGGTLSNVPIPSFHNSLSQRTYAQSALFTSTQQLSNLTAALTVNSTIWGARPSLQDAPLNLSTVQAENSELLPDFSRVGREYAPFAVGQATGPNPSCSSHCADFDTGRERQFCGTDESSIQVNTQPGTGEECVSIMCSETEEETMDTDQEKPQNVRQDTLVELNLPSTSKEPSWAKIVIEGSSGAATSSPRTLALKSTKAGAKIPIVREPPSVTRRIDLSSLRQLSPMGTLLPSVFQEGFPAREQTVREFSRQTTTISHSIVNITKKSPRHQEAQQIPVRPLPILGVPVPADSSVSARTVLKPNPTVRPATINPLQSAVPISLPPLSVFTAPFRIVPSSVPLLPPRVPEPRLRLPVSRTRATRRKFCPLKRGTGRPRKGKQSPRYIPRGIEARVNDDVDIDSQGRNRVNLNARERERVSLLNDGFDTLRRVLPWSSKIGRRVSKVDTLRAAISYIDYLQTLLKESEEVTAFQPVCSGSKYTSRLCRCSCTLPSRADCLPTLSFGVNGVHLYPYIFQCNSAQKSPLCLQRGSSGIHSGPLFHNAAASYRKEYFATAPLLRSTALTSSYI